MEPKLKKAVKLWSQKRLKDSALSIYIWLLNQDTSSLNDLNIKEIKKQTSKDFNTIKRALDELQSHRLIKAKCEYKKTGYKIEVK